MDAVTIAYVGPARPGVYVPSVRLEAAYDHDVEVAADVAEQLLAQDVWEPRDAAADAIAERLATAEPDALPDDGDDVGAGEHPPAAPAAVSRPRNLLEEPLETKPPAPAADEPQED